MSALAAPLPVIRPITDLRTQLNDVCTQATELQEPIVLTKNGVASFVLMDSNAYETTERRNRVYLALREAEIEEKYRPETAQRRRFRCEDARDLRALEPRLPFERGLIMLELAWRPRAHLDRESIAIYLGLECKNPQAALAAIQRIDAAIEHARSFPDAGGRFA